MNGRSLMVLVLAVVLGLGAMLATRRLMSKPAAAEEETQEILVAARDFKEEEILKPDMVKAVRMSKSAIPVGAFSSFKDVEERWVKTTMLEGDPIVDKKLGPKGTPPGLVANIPKGMRAFAVEVNEQSGVSGFILPGHRVDVVRYEANEKIPAAAGRDDSSGRPGPCGRAGVHPSGGEVAPEPDRDPGSHARAGAISWSPPGRRDPCRSRSAGSTITTSSIAPSRSRKKARSRRRDRTKLEKELEELKLALAKKLAEPPPPPPPPAPKPPEPRPPQKRTVYIYRPLLDKEEQDLWPSTKRPGRSPRTNRTATTMSPAASASATPTVTKVDPDGKGTIDRDH